MCVSVIYHTDNHISGKQFLGITDWVLFKWKFDKDIICSLVGHLLKYRCYEVRAKYVGAKKRKGVRGSVYRHAEEHEAYYSLDHSKSIFYNDSNDFCSVTKEKLCTFLSQWYLNNPMAVQYGDVSVEDDLEVVYVAESILKRVHLSHYNAIY